MLHCLVNRKNPLRTTVTLEDDVVANLNDRMARSGASFKEALNDSLRRGLELPTEDELVRPFRVRSRPMGVRRGVELDNIGELLDLLDGIKTINSLL